MASLSAAKKTIDLARLVTMLREHPRPLLLEERRLVDDWMGWGAVDQLFNPRAAVEWTTLGVELENALPAEWIESARAATVTSYFTNRYMVDAIWSLLTQLGFTSGLVLEPGCGSGQFLAAAPPELSIKFTGIEREPFSAYLAQLRFPQAKIVNESLEDVVLTEEGFDVVIGNVPFADVPMKDKETGIRLTLHNFFIWRAIRATRPGGLIALLTSRYTLDARDPFVRTEFAKKVNFLGAFRLPSGAHKAAGTEVVTDLLVFQKKAPGQVPEVTHEWAQVEEFLHPEVGINRYFVEHPEQILGEATIGRGMYRPNELLIKAPENLPAALQEAVERFVAQARAQGSVYLPPADHATISDELVVRRSDKKKEGSYHLDERGQLVQVIGGQLKPVSDCVAEIKMLLALRDAALALLEAERDLDRSDESLYGLRHDLNLQYDAYVRRFGAINRATICYSTRKKKTPPALTRVVSEDDLPEAVDEDEEETVTRRRPKAMYKFAQDPDYTVVIGLEDYDDERPEGKRAKKAEIFYKRVHRRPERRTTAETPSEALALCLDEYGHFDIEVIARLLRLPVEQVPAAMGELVFEDPATFQWEQRSRYLAGNVRIKLVQARKAAQVESRFQRNVTALEAVMPQDLIPGEIKAILGAPWIAPEDIAHFCLDLLSMRVAVKYEPLTATWGITTLPGNTPANAANVSQWGTRRMDAITLIEHGLNKRIPIIYDTYDDSKVKNASETLAAQEKLQAIQERFTPWIWEDNERATRLAEVYNRLFNSEVPEVFDGSHLTFPGMNPSWESCLYPWQKDFVARAVANRSALCAYPVGAGKTSIEVMVAMTLRRLGLISRAAIVVPNHLLEQIASEAQRLYPSARILIISRNDLSKERKGIFAARVAAGDYDVVVMTHAAFFALGVHPQTERRFLEERKTLYRQALADLQGDDDSSIKRRTVKQIEKALMKMEERRSQLVSKVSDGVTFEQLGISYLVVDEFHLYKNLGLPTRVQGFQVQASKRAADMEMKLSWLKEHTEGRPFASAFTATPLSNNMVEAYVMAWYLDKEGLFERGLHSVEAFVSTFIEMQTRVEVSPDGSTFRQFTRPACFINLPEFKTVINRFMDIRPPEMLDAKRPKRRNHVVKVTPTPQVLAYVESLVKRAERLRAGHVRDAREDNMLLVTTDGRKVATWGPLVGVHAEHEPKLEAVAREVLKIFERNQTAMAELDGEYKSFQIIFCDLGTPSEERGDQVYGALKKLLMAGGLPRHAIRFIHEAKGDAAKAALFQQCRNGQVAVLLGSTEMLGVGTNIQTRCAALHHVDGTWRPDQIEQREGRCHRPGNRFSHVDIFYYVQERTFDAYVWQMLKNKAKFFKQLSSGKLDGREMAAQSDTELSFGQVMAAATGNPLLLEKAEIEIKLGQLQRSMENHKRTCYRNRQEARICRQGAEDRRAQIQRLERLLSIKQGCKLTGFVTLQGEFLTDGTKIGQAVEKVVMTALMRSSRHWYDVGKWHDIPLSVRAEGNSEHFSAELLVGTEMSWGSRLSINNSWFGTGQHWRIAREVESFLDHLPQQIGEAEYAIERFERDAVSYDQLADLPFEKEDEYRTFLIRKIALDNYTAMVASGGNQEEIEARKAALLAEATIAVEVNLEAEMGVEETYLVPVPAAAPEAVVEPEPVLAVEPVPTYAQVVATVEKEVEHLSLDQLLAVSLFGTDLPEQQARAPRPRKKSPRKKRPAPTAPVALQLELLAPIPFPVKTTAKQKTAAQSSWLDLVEDQQRDAA
ncbi:MAG TPA: helicase-related protein [Ktedonobacteraceae bacterium]|nr:helicase-related protein [Ktedonobacteraceae bacterium]